MNSFRFFSKSLTLFVLLVALTVTSFSCNSVRNNEDTTVSASGSSTPDPALTAPEPNETTDENGNEKTADVAAETSSAVAGSEGLAFSDFGGGRCIITGIGTCTDTDLYIPSIIDGLTVIGIDHNAFENQTEIKSVFIPDTVRMLGGFKGCTGLTEIAIPTSVTSIDPHAFSGCTGLTGITIPDSVNSIGDFAFQGCTFSSIVMPGKVKYIGTAALSRSSLTEVTLPEWVESLAPPIIEKLPLTEITIPGIYFEIVCSLSSASDYPYPLISYCDNLKTINTDLTVAKMNALLQQNPYLIDYCGFTAVPETNEGSLFTGTIKCTDGETLWCTTYHG